MTHADWVMPHPPWCDFAAFATPYVTSEYFLGPWIDSNGNALKVETLDDSGTRLTAKLSKLHGREVDLPIELDANGYGWQCGTASLVMAAPEEVRWSFPNGSLTIWTRIGASGNSESSYASYGGEAQFGFPPFWGSYFPPYEGCPDMMASYPSYGGRPRGKSGSGSKRLSSAAPNTVSDASTDVGEDTPGEDCARSPSDKKGGWTGAVPPEARRQRWASMCDSFDASDPTSSAQAHAQHAVDPFKKKLTQQDETKTTVMLRNLPNDYTRAALLELMDQRGFPLKYDFVYLPIDFKFQAGLGYAFVNFVSPQDAQRCWEVFEGFQDWGLKTSKTCSVTWGDPLQGLEAYITRYRDSPVMHNDVPDEWKPVLFKDGRRLPFPPPTKFLKPPKLRMR
jgi:hypothetical protein